VRLARRYQVSDFFIGVVILAVGSDLPELVVSIAAAVRQFAGEETANLIVGNALGSCLGQFGLVMGTAGMLGRLSLPRRQTLIHGGVLLASLLLLAATGWDGVVSRPEGALLVASFLVYLLSLVGAESRASRKPTPVDHTRVGRTWLTLIIGMTLVLVSADVIVNRALTLAELWGVDQSYIGITIIGVGTSLPELMISVGAALRARMGLSVGNLLGSNILDTLLPIGIAAVIAPLRFDPALLAFDLPMLFGLSAVILIFLFRATGIRKPQAVMLLLCYAGYIATISHGA